ncbi:MAG: hypothetical protein CXR31_00355 [Geobacter sp.]|nr:MAG: hypothetical protein CXR31_00355 [Geobacter sp.]
MSAWNERAFEERALLVPSFSSVLIWYAAVGHQTEAESGLPFDASFLVLPIVLHRETRELLPKTVATSLAVWLDEHPLVRARIADRAQVIVPFTKEAIVFGGIHGLIRVTGHEVVANPDWKRQVAAGLKNTSDEVKACAKRAEFVGRWFAKTGSCRTVMALLGVRP